MEHGYIGYHFLLNEFHEVEILGFIIISEKKKISAALQIC
jgi:hypothetical protein